MLQRKSEENLGISVYKSQNSVKELRDAGSNVAHTAGFCKNEGKTMINGWKIGYMPTGSYESMSPEAICESLKIIGYDTVEWTQAFADPFTCSHADLRRLAEVPKSFDMEVSEVVVQKDLIVLEDEVWRYNVDLIKEAIRRYSDVGFHTINLFTGPIPWKEDRILIGKHLSEGKAWELLLRAFDEIVPLAEQYKMNLAMENVWCMLCHDIYTMKYLINHYHSPYLGVNYDPSHDVLAGHSDVEWIITQWDDKIKHVHLKDAVGIQEPGKFVFPLLGEGDVDWNAFLNALKKVGYNGAMSVEFESFRYVDLLWKGDWTKAAKNAYENIEVLFGGK